MGTQTHVLNHENIKARHAYRSSTHSGCIRYISLPTTLDMVPIHSSVTTQCTFRSTMHTIFSNASTTYNSLETMIRNMFTALKHKTLRRKAAQASAPMDLPYGVSIHPPTLPFHPTWSETFDISIPTATAFASWEPYSLTCTHPPGSLIHPAYSEMPAHHRKSEGQYFARIGLKLTHDPKHLHRENAKLSMQRRKADLRMRAKDDVIESLEADVRHMIKMNKLPLKGVLRRHLQLLGRY